MKIIKKYFIPMIALALVIIACVKINIVNTEALSPLGNTDDNFKLVSSEFGDEFQNFIKDKSPVKIYIGEKNDGEAMVKVYNMKIKLTTNNFFVNTIEKIVKTFRSTFINVKDKINKSTKNNSNIEKQDSYNNNFDEKVNKFLESVKE